jgi:hypothetical protein
MRGCLSFLSVGDVGVVEGHRGRIWVRGEGPEQQLFMLANIVGVVEGIRGRVVDGRGEEPDQQGRDVGCFLSQSVRLRAKRRARN